MSRAPAWDVVPVLRGDRTVRVSRWTCSGCDARHERVITNRTPPPAEAVVKWATRDGWRVDPHRRGAIRCPQCLCGTTAHSLDQSPPVTDTPRIIEAMAEPVAATKPAPTPREPTQAERLKIRSILDSHFDDGAGCWLDGYSDQKAGEACGVPWSLVTRIREAAYGPIRVDPEVAGIQAAIRLLRADLAKQAEAIADLEKRATALQAKRAA